MASNQERPTRLLDAASDVLALEGWHPDREKAVALMAVESILNRA